MDFELLDLLDKIEEDLLKEHIPYTRVGLKIQVYPLFTEEFNAIASKYGVDVTN